jgi:hypothetical protein
MQLLYQKAGWQARRVLNGEAVAVLLVLSAAVLAAGQTNSGPIAIVPLNAKNPAAAPKVTGGLEVSQGKAMIAVSGSVTAGNATTEVTLPRRGVLRVCATTTVKLASDSSVPAEEVSGLMMAMDHGAIEASFAIGRNSDILLTPNFRILMGGPGSADVKVRLGEQGDTCVENAGTNAPYVLVSSVFDGGAYRVQSGQRVTFLHGSLTQVVDNEKESCGCPPPATQGNEFPLAQSEGLAPQSPPVASKLGVQAPIAAGLAYNAADHAVPATPSATQAPAAPAGNKTASAAPAKPVVTRKKTRGMHRVGRFFRHIFGAE